MHPTVKRIFFASAVLALLVGTAHGGLLVGDANASISGTEGFSGLSFGGVGAATLIADVDYAVYAPGDFGLSVVLGLPAGDDPSGGSEWVYAYQIDNDKGGDKALTALTIDLNPGVITNLANVSDTSTTLAGGLAPTTSTFIPIAVDPPTNVKWSFTSPVLSVGLDSGILLFTSPFGPTFSNASIAGASASLAPLAGDANFLPTPIPEPSTLVLSALAAVLLAAGYLRRRKV